MSVFSVRVRLHLHRGQARGLLSRTRVGNAGGVAVALSLVGRVKATKSVSYSSHWNLVREGRRGAMTAGAASIARNLVRNVSRGGTSVLREIVVVGVHVSNHLGSRVSGEIADGSFRRVIRGEGANEGQVFANAIGVREGFSLYLTYVASGLYYT